VPRASPLSSPPSPLHAVERGSEQVRLGVASYSLAGKFSRAQAIEIGKALGTPYINLKSVHLTFELAPEELAAGRRENRSRRAPDRAAATITFDEDSDDGCASTSTTRSGGDAGHRRHGDPRSSPHRAVRQAVRYQGRIHNHGPEDKHFPSPYDVLKHVRNMDPRHGVVHRYRATRYGRGPTWCARRPTRGRAARHATPRTRAT